VTDTTPLIGLYSPAPQSGKSTVASFLTEHGFHTVPFAGPLKRMLRTFLLQLGYGPEGIDHYLTTGKEDILPGIACSPRHLMRTLGTEWGRSCVHPSVWLLCWQSTATRYLQSGTPIVVDDVRFPNEADLIRSLGGQLWRIDRPSAERNTEHASEGSLDTYAFDHVLSNDSTLTDLYSRTRELLADSPSIAIAA
jgi:hypothetical protein